MFNQCLIISPYISFHHQCCLIRASTLAKLLNFHKGIPTKLSTAVAMSYTGQGVPTWHYFANKNSPSSSSPKPSPSSLNETLSSSTSTPYTADPVAPVLARGHLDALDRRVGIILKVIHQCTQNYSWDEVVKDDGFWRCFKTRSLLRSCVNHVKIRVMTHVTSFSFSSSYICFRLLVVFQVIPWRDADFALLNL